MTASQHKEEIKIAVACYANGQWSYISDQNKRVKKLTQSLKFERIDVLAQKLVIMTTLESYRINDTPKNFKVKSADSLMRYHLKCVAITLIRAKPETRADRWIADALISN